MENDKGIVLISQDSDEFVEALENEEDLNSFRKNIEKSQAYSIKKVLSKNSSLDNISVDSLYIKGETNSVFTKNYGSQQDKFLESKSKIENKVYKKRLSDSFNLSKPDISNDVKENIEEEFTSVQFKKMHRNIDTKSKGISERQFKTLYEVQVFNPDHDTIWVCKISYDNNHIAVGGVSGIMKLWKICNLIEEKSSNFNRDFSLIDVNSLKQFLGHTKDIIDLCWAANNNNLLLTCSIDQLTILWDISKIEYLFKFDHLNIVTCISFCPNNDDYFVSGCLDKIIRVFDIKKKKVVDYLNVSNLITAITYSTCGQFIVVGYHNGICEVFTLVKHNIYIENKLKLLFQFECRNRYGGFSKGRKVTSIEFINKNDILITTNDSRLRLFNLKQRKITQKLKGLTNEDNIIRGSFDENSQFIVSSSDDCNVFIWKKSNDMDNLVKTGNYEYFTPFINDKPTFSFILNETILLNYQKKFFINKIFVKTIFINLSKGGKIQVLIDVIFLDDNQKND